ncbi:hypothetical protein ACLB1E_15260 [Escherichia coli]
MVHLPNVRALNRALRDAPWSALCYLRIPGMEMLVKNYGIMLQINTSKNFLTGCHPCWNRVKMFISFRVTNLASTEYRIAPGAHYRTG